MTRNNCKARKRKYPVLPLITNSQWPDWQLPGSVLSAAASHTAMYLKLLPSIPEVIGLKFKLGVVIILRQTTTDV